MASTDFISKYKWPLIALVIVLIIIGGIVGMYNSFVTLDQDVKGKWSEVENQYQRQADLIPNLNTTLNRYMQFEKSTLMEITQLRSQWQAASTDLEKDTVGMQMTSSLGRLIATFEAYPDLKTIQTVNSLMDELSGTQNRLATARGRYITSIQAFNTAIQQFPGVLFARMFGFIGREYYHAASDALVTPHI